MKTHTQREREREIERKRKKERDLGTTVHSSFSRNLSQNRRGHLEEQACWKHSDNTDTAAKTNHPSAPQLVYKQIWHCWRINNTKDRRKNKTERQRLESDLPSNFPSPGIHFLRVPPRITQPSEPAPHLSQQETGSFTSAYWGRLLLLRAGEGSAEHGGVTPPFLSLSAEGDLGTVHMGMASREQTQQESQSQNTHTRTHTHTHTHRKELKVSIKYCQCLSGSMRGHCPLPRSLVLTSTLVDCIDWLLIGYRLVQSSQHYHLDMAGGCRGRGGK